MPRGSAVTPSPSFRVEIKMRRGAAAVAAGDYDDDGLDYDDADAGDFFEDGSAALGADYDDGGDHDDYDNEDFSTLDAGASSSSSAASAKKYLIRSKTTALDAKHAQVLLETPVPKSVFNTVTYAVDVEIPLKSLEKSGQKIALSIPNGAINENPKFSNAEDATPEALAHGACDLVDMITVSELQTDLPGGNLLFNFPTVNALESEKFPLGAATKNEALGAHYGTVNDTIATTKKVLLDRKTTNGMIEYVCRHPGMMGEHIRQTAFRHPKNPKDAMVFLESPAVDFYNEHPKTKQLGLPLIDETMRSRADGHGYVLIEGASDHIFNTIIPECEQETNKKIGYSNVTDPKTFCIEVMAAPRSRMNAKGKFEKQVVSFKELAARSMGASVPASVASKNKKTVAALIDEALDQPVSLKFNVTVHYLKAHKGFTLGDLPLAGDS